MGSKQISVTISLPVKETLEELAMKKGLSKSAIVTLALEEYARKEKRESESK